MKAIINGKIILKDRIVQKHILLYDKKIIKVIKEKDFDVGDVEGIIDGKNQYVSPGFIDLHIHGEGGFDTMDATYEALNNISKSIIENGVTSFLPTTMTMEKKHIWRALKNIREAMNRGVEGAKILGAHMEGPFISKEHKGAQNEAFIVKPDSSWVIPHKDIIKIITFAPEEDPKGKFIDEVKKHKTIKLAIGHTNATFEEAIKAMDKGVTYITHTFNAMSGFHHRDPGVVGAVFSRDVDCELIADGIHVHQGFLQAFIDIKKKDRVILVTDCVRAGSMESGEYELGGQKITLGDGCARLADGTLAGSVLKLSGAIRNVQKHTNYKLHEIVNMASLNPARVVGLEDQFGSIEKGKHADLVIFDDNINASKTIIDGNVVYEIKG